MKIKAIPFFIVLGCAGLTHAQTQAPAQLLPAVSVVASPILEDTRVDAFGSVSAVVSEDQLRDQNAVDLASALRRTPGVQISRFNPVGAFGGDEGGAVFIRGMGASRPGAEVKTYVDGLPFYLGVWNHPLLDLLPLNGMQSITVHKSPQPQISGNNFASVNLATKRATENGLHGSGRVSAGSFGTIIEQVDLLGRAGDVDYMLAQGHAKSDGHRANADGELNNVMGRIGLRIDDHWSMGASVLNSRNSATDPGDQRLAAPAVAPTFDTQGTMFSASLSHRHGDSRGELSLYANRGKSEWLNQVTTGPFQTTDTLTKFRMSGLRWHEELTPWSGGRLIAGIDHDRLSGEVDNTITVGGRSLTDLPDFRITSPHVALSQRVAVGKGWDLVPAAGVRFYKHSDFSSETAPQAGVSLVSDQLTVFANLSRGINYPGLDAVIIAALVPGLGESWRQLAVEELDHAELGVKFSPAAATTVDLSVFEDKVKNHYVFVPFSSFTNVGDSRVRGTELSLKQDIGREWSVFAGLTLLDPTLPNLPYAPERALTLGANGAIGPVRIALDAQYQSRVWALNRSRNGFVANTEQVDAFTVLNARLSYVLPALGKKGEVFLAAENLFDRDYQFRPGYPMAGRSAQVGIAASF